MIYANKIVFGTESDKVSVEICTGCLFIYFHIFARHLVACNNNTPPPQRSAFAVVEYRLTVNEVGDT